MPLSRCPQALPLLFEWQVGLLPLAPLPTALAGVGWQCCAGGVAVSNTAQTAIAHKAPGKHRLPLTT